MFGSFLITPFNRVVMVGIFHRLRSIHPTGYFANSVYTLEFVGRDSYLDTRGRRVWKLDL